MLADAGPRACDRARPAARKSGRLCCCIGHRRPTGTIPCLAPRSRPRGLPQIGPAGLSPRERNERGKPMPEIWGLRRAECQPGSRPLTHIEPIGNEVFGTTPPDSADLVGRPLLARRQFGHRRDQDVPQVRLRSALRRHGRQHPSRPLVVHQAARAVDRIQNAFKLCPARSACHVEKSRSRFQGPP